MSAKTRVQPEPASAAATVEPELSVQEIADRLNWSRDTVVARCEDSAMPHRMRGKRRRFLESEVAEWQRKTLVTKAPARGAGEGHPVPEPRPAATSSDLDWEAEARATRLKRSAR